MTVERLREFLDSLAFDSDVKWWLKRLSANDTQLTQGHQAGPYVPRDILFAMIPELDRPDVENPREDIEAEIVSHQHTSTVTAIWYNNRLRGKTRNETRITGWGGSSSPLLDPELTGAAAIFAFGGVDGARWCKIWVSVTEDETDFIEERFGEIEPGAGLVFPPTERQAISGGCGLSSSEMPETWLRSFPSPNDVLEKSLELRPNFAALDPDNRLLRRRVCEYELFLSIENATWLPRIHDGFSTLNEFLSVAQTILQRRRSRSGKSLEKHIFRIFREEKLLEGIHFDAQVETESGRTPDFVFPSETAYYDSAFDSRKLRMLAVKTTLRERWSQVVDEADRIANKHLLTLQEGLSEKQYAQIQGAGLTLVVPTPLQKHYPDKIRQELLSLEQFIGEISSL